MQEYKSIDENENMSDAPEQLNKNFHTLQSNFAGAEEPEAPSQGQFWFNTSTGMLEFYNGSNFIGSVPCNISGVANKAKADESGRTIADNYLLNSSASNTYLSKTDANDIYLSKADADTRISTIEKNLSPLIYASAAAHNSIYRGKYLGTSVTAAQWATIKAGTFEDLYIGDYWTIGGVDYVIAAFDYYLNTCWSPTVTAHHVTIVPRKNMYTHVMNDTNTSAGAYVGSKMYQSGLNNAKTAIANAFGSAHILTIRQLFQNAVTNGYETGQEWYDASVWLMSEFNVYGSLVWKNAYAATNWRCNYTIDNSQYPVFMYDKTMIHTHEDYWLRDVAGSGDFAYVTSAGYCSSYSASRALGVRPAFNIYQS